MYLERFSFINKASQETFNPLDKITFFFFSIVINLTIAPDRFQMLAGTTTSHSSLCDATMIANFNILNYIKCVYNYVIKMAKVKVDHAQLQKKGGENKTNDPLAKYAGPLKLFSRHMNETKKDARKHEYYLRPGLKAKEKVKDNIKEALKTRR